jgi:adenylosuccinate lyase
MLRIWSPRHKFNTWRRIWLAVAEAQQACGLSITDKQIAELRAVVERGITDEELARAAELERDLRHDVMAHVHCLGEQCPKAKPIIHLGCTSQDVVCNADLLILFEAESLAAIKIDRAFLAMGETAARTAAIPVLGFTHYQAAQPTTVGKRCAQWAEELQASFARSARGGDQSQLKLRGFRGATGTQASFLALFGGDASRVDRFEAIAIWKLTDQQAEFDMSFDEYLEVLRDGLNHVGNALGDDENAPEIDEAGFVAFNTFGLTGQTYPRYHDTHVLSALASVASVLHKIATDIRLLSNRKELDEPFGKSQIGSSAMPYKRNPMKCERICGLARFVMNMVGNAYDTAATQWLERTLDDSANRRLSLPESFLALDGCLDLMHEVASGLVVNEAMVRKNLMEELPFLATENILMEAVKAGGDRQDLHESIRVHAQAAGQRVKQEGLDNDLLGRLRADPMFQSKAKGGHLDRDLNWDNLMDPMQYVGRSVEQTERFVREVVDPLREQYADELAALGSSDRGV